MEKKEIVTVEFEVVTELYEQVKILASKENKTVEEFLVEVLECYCEHYSEFEANYNVAYKVGIV